MSPPSSMSHSSGKYARFISSPSHTRRQCILHESTLALNKKQLEDQEIIHTFKMRQTEDKYRAAEMLWEKKRNELRADVNKYKGQASICDKFHIPGIEHKAVVNNLGKELNKTTELAETLRAENEILSKRVNKLFDATSDLLGEVDDQDTSPAQEEQRGNDELAAVASLSLDQGGQ
ncbi:uncharacterized protein PAC_19844 [Phialocephala subalpina]|uniref:Uncharacterized protein n=1 Tax=Phialocephala subalpina TaxID=576137 RepID=A0A1L7XXZ5_9HELO|nr:uncharacterized protein PAC_19844 [Phialocephala subalpina]